MENMWKIIDPKKIDEHVKLVMLNYPRITPSRIEWWIHAFGSFGNGYEWDENGNFLYFYSESADATEIKYVPVTPLQSDDLPELRMREELERAKNEIRNKYIDVIVKDTTFKVFTERNALSINRMDWGYSRMCQAARMPEKIAKEWREEIYQFCNWFKSSVWGLCSGHFAVQLRKHETVTDEMILEALGGSKLRRFQELRHNYKLVVKVMDMILLPEDKEEKRKQEEEILQWVKDFTNET